MTATYRVHTNNFSELEKIISNNKIHNDYENSMIDDEILKYFGYSENNKVRNKKGEYAYELVDDYYTFSVNLEEILP